MKRIKQWISIAKSRNARGLILLGILLFNIGLWFFSSILALIIEPDTYQNVAKALWESGITWMLEPGFYDPSLSDGIRILSIVVIITSMITFTGGIIGYVANVFSSIIDDARKGKGKLNLYEHILILNYNSKALELISDYQHDDLTTLVVVLSDQDKSFVENQISRKLKENHQKKSKLKVIVRQGEVFSKTDLSDVCIKESKAIIILSNEDGSVQELDTYDTHVMKTLMLVSKMDLKSEQTIIVEVKQQETACLIKEYIAKQQHMEDQILPIFSDELMGRLIAQTLLMPALNKVYHEVFSFDGAEFYHTDQMNAFDFIKTHHKAIPIYVYKDILYVLAANHEDVLAMNFDRNLIERDLVINPRYHIEEQQLVIFGKNQKLPFILDSLNLFQKEDQIKINVTLIDSNDRLTIEAHVKEIKKIDTILILSEEFLEPKAYDSKVLVTLLTIQDLASKHQAEVIIELLDPRHYDIAQSYRIDNTIVSNEYISRMMTQLSKNRELYHLYLDLLTFDPEDSKEETYELYTYKADHFFEMKFPIYFSSPAEMIYNCYIAGKEEVIVLGYFEGEQMIIFKNNLDEQKEIIINENDDIIAISK